MGPWGLLLCVSLWNSARFSLSDPVTCELFLLLEKCPIDGKQIWPRRKTNFNQVIDLDDPSPTQLHPTQKSYQTLYHQARCTQSLGGQLPIPELVGNAAVDGVGVVSSGGLGGPPRGELCLHDTVCQSDLLWLRYFVVIGTISPSHSCFYK